MISSAPTGENGMSLPRRKRSNGHLLTVSEVARMMRAHPNSVRRWANIGLLPSFRIGLRGDRRFGAQDVNVFLESFHRYQRTPHLAGRGV